MLSAISLELFFKVTIRIQWKAQEVIWSIKTWKCNLTLEKLIFFLFHFFLTSSFILYSRNSRETVESFLHFLQPLCREETPAYFLWVLVPPHPTLTHSKNTTVPNNHITCLLQMTFTWIYLIHHFSSTVIL